MVEIGKKTAFKTEKDRISKGLGNSSDETVIYYSTVTTL